MTASMQSGLPDVIQDGAGFRSGTTDPGVDRGISRDFVHEESDPTWAELGASRRLATFADAHGQVPFLLISKQEWAPPGDPFFVW